MTHQPKFKSGIVANPERRALVQNGRVDGAVDVEHRASKLGIALLEVAAYHRVAGVRREAVKEVARLHHMTWEDAVKEIIVAMKICDHAVKRTLSCDVVT